MRLSALSIWLEFSLLALKVVPWGQDPVCRITTVWADRGCRDGCVARGTARGRKGRQRRGVV